MQYWTMRVITGLPLTYKGKENQRTAAQEAVKIAFQSTLPRGERREDVRGKSLQNQFQSTLPRGERLKLTHEKDVAQLFQSTLPRGERHH